jgi:uncharacterized protein (TIGR02246 family)
MDRARLADWLARYESAWRSPGTEALAGLFTHDATYSTRPYETPHRGLEAIARMWEAERPAGEQFEISTEIVAVEGDTGVARIEVHYHRPREQQYRDLWIVRLDDSGRCFHFEEWPFWPPGSRGAAAGGA